MPIESGEDLNEFDARLRQVALTLLASMAGDIRMIREGLSAAGK